MEITRTDLQRMIDHCIAGLPHEACGILGGKIGRVGKVYAMKNARPGPVSYEMDPEEQFRVMKDIRAEGLVMVGVFHSHPSGQAYPSGVDVDRAFWPGTNVPNYPEAVYIIISLLDRVHPVVRGFLIEGKTVTEVPVAVVED